MPVILITFDKITAFVTSTFRHESSVWVERVGGSSSGQGKR